MTRINTGFANTIPAMGEEIKRYQGTLEKAAHFNQSLEALNESFGIAIAKLKEGAITNTDLVTALGEILQTGDIHSWGENLRVDPAKKSLVEALGFTPIQDESIRKLQIPAQQAYAFAARFSARDDKSRHAEVDNFVEERLQVNEAFYLPQAESFAQRITNHASALSNKAVTIKDPRAETAPKSR